MKFLRLLFAPLLLVAVLSCDSDPEPACDVQNPVEELEWIRTLINDAEASELAEYFYLVQAKYLTQTVFYMKNCCPFCNSAYIMYNCQGESICVQGQCNEQLIFDEQVIWAPPQASCSL